MHVSSQQLIAIVRSLICQVRALLAGLFGKSVMRKAVLSLASVYCFFTLLAFAAQVPASQPPKTTETIPVSQIHTGMRGVAYTVFQGTKPEPMDVEVLGVLKNMNGPKGDIILVRLPGAKAEYTGVVAGMSGSPVYFDGKLAGALAFRIGEFSKEPIAGVTPIEEMFEINALDSRPIETPVRAGETPSGKTPTAGPGVGSAALTPDYRNYLKPIEAPFVFSGFSDATLQRYADQFSAAGITPVMGTGSSSDRKQPEPVATGSAVSA